LGLGLEQVSASDLAFTLGAQRGHRLVRVRVRIRGWG
jgi:hypothetical protein